MNICISYDLAVAMGASDEVLSFECFENWPQSSQQVPNCIKEH